MQKGMKQQDLAVASGYWPLFRYNPALREINENPFVLDSPGRQCRSATTPITRCAKGAGAEPAREAAVLMAQAQAALNEKYRNYEEMAGWSATRSIRPGCATAAS